MSEPTQPENIELSPDFVKRMNESFVDDRQLLLDDALNNSVGLGAMAFGRMEVLWEYLQNPVKTYEEYIQGTWGGKPGQAEYILGKSDPKTVAEYDAKVAEFNKDRERIMREKDFEAVQRYTEALGELIQRRRPE